MDITGLLNQQIQWVPRTGLTNRGDPEYGQLTTLIGRWTPKYRDILTPTGDTVTTTALATLTTEVAIGDTLNGREVIQVTGMVAFDGTAVGFQALCR